METMTVSELKANFAEVLKKVQAGEDIAIAEETNSPIVACLVPQDHVVKPQRKLGILEGKGKVIFSDDFKMTTEEFLGL